jgi:hypothetical protein
MKNVRKEKPMRKRRRAASETLTRYVVQAWRVNEIAPFRERLRRRNVKDEALKWEACGVFGARDTVMRKTPAGFLVQKIKRRFVVPCARPVAAVSSKTW